MFMSRILRCGAWAFFDRRVLGGLQKAKMDTATPSYGPPCPLSFIQREAAALKNEPPLLGRMKMYLLYDGFFSFAVVRQISIDTFLKAPLLLLVTLFLLQLLYRYIL